MEHGGIFNKVSPPTAPVVDSVPAVGWSLTLGSVSWDPSEVLF